jgi:hypothetical protein
MLRLIITLTAISLLACTHPQETPDTKVSKAVALSGEGKPTAPVEISAEVTPTHARLSLRFEANTEQATVTVSGLDGLTITQAPEAAPRKYGQGEVSQVDVDYTGESGTLVINVSGTFNGANKSRVVTFAVGEVKPASSGTKVTPTNGPGIKALPSGK